MFIGSIQPPDLAEYLKPRARTPRDPFAATAAKGAKRAPFANSAVVYARTRKTVA